MAYRLEHILIIISSFILHLTIFRWLAAPVLKKMSPVFDSLPHKKQVLLANSVMSMFHGVVVGGIGAYNFMYPGGVVPTAFWLDSAIVRQAGCIFLGYTVADILLMATHPSLYEPMMMVHHGIGVVAGVLCSMVPVLPYYMNLCGVTELSSPSVHMRIILHALGQQTSRLYKLNGVVMLVTFFVCRIVAIPLWFQLLSQHMVTGEIYTAGPLVPFFYLVCIPLVMVFNIYWFGKMCRGAYRALYHVKA